MMLHEVLLALSGHPSPLFADSVSDHDASDIPLLSPSEKALLDSVGRLSELHRRLKRHLETISSTHVSVICRAVATSVQQTHLARFQKKILDTESKILKNDASIVGAYEIVPLAALVAEFDAWPRLMSWYWDLATFMSSPKHDSGSGVQCTSARLIDKLRAETQTGFPEIEDAATELARAAERAWLRQLSSWIVYGKLPTLGARDFFIRAEGDEGSRSFAKKKELLPSFVTPSLAASLLFIGKSIHQVEYYRRSSNTRSTPSIPAADQTQLASDHLQQLSSLSLPIVPSQFSRTIAHIRLSLSQNVLQHLLPMSETVQVLVCLRQFFLLDRGEFATALIAEAEERVQSRQQNMGKLLAQDPVKALQSLSMKDTELNQVLRQVWRSLAAADENGEDATLDYAQSQISLTNPKYSSSRPSTADSSSDGMPEISSIAFNNLLFPNPTELSMTISPPLDLFLSSRDLETYTAISSYLLAIRRGHQRLNSLWKRTPARRDHPVSTAQQSDLRPRHNQRNIAMRRVWATCSAAIFMLSETAAFFEGEIVRQSCEHFQTWIEEPLRQSTRSTSSIASDKPIQRDPETLAAGHRTFLSSLTYALLLTDMQFTRELRSLLGNVDNLIAYFQRLLDMQQKMDFEQQSGSESAHTVSEEQRMSLELDRARKKVDSDLKSVIRRLRQLDGDRVGSLRHLEQKRPDQGDFEAWKDGGSIDRLLMKLEFGRMVVDGYEVFRT
ncbi:Gamma-tubulin complex component 4 [Pseudocercospora fuligena]|uniref:Spindle pole body component n=1 Tax=Pseudocercospora fuligena TaxID=685502 RepID=A0A8H6RTN9_9PEZI|nr:Gamma-tubulin complex component 4 [Pseudocercospora fuligena]